VHQAQAIFSMVYLFLTSAEKTKDRYELNKILPFTYEDIPQPSLHIHLFIIEKEELSRCLSSSRAAKGQQTTRYLVEAPFPMRNSQYGS